jgi:hypothetical protein
MLLRDGLVMYDRETDTLWTHVDGRAIKGVLRGTVLEIVPSIHATWKAWKTLYPQSLVLQKRGEIRSAYESYNRDQRRMGVLGRRLRDQRLPPKERIIGVRSNDGATAFVEKDVRAAKLVEAQVGSLPIAGLPDARSHSGFPATIPRQSSMTRRTAGGPSHRASPWPDR